MDLVNLKNSVCLVKSILGNGDCLFASISHQMFEFDIGTVMHKAMTSTMREMAVNYIRDNSGNVELKLAIVLRVEEEIPVLCGDSDERTVQNFLPLLATTGVWGGDESIHALSLKFGCTIIIFREGECCVTAPCRGDVPTRIVRIVYRGQVNR